MSRHLLLQACALHKLRVHFGDVSSAFLQTSVSEERQEFTIKAPPEVGCLFSDSEGKLARCVRLMKSFYGLTSAPRAWWLDITQKLSQLGWKPMSTDQCLWCRYSDDGELKGVIGIHVDDFLIGLADGMLGEKFCIAGDLGRFRNLNLLESGCDNIVTFPSQLTLKTTLTNSSLKLPSHVNDQDSDKNL